jgi:SWI/SNF-related matrix-associated actin-dependent regulator of chromatin subfamily A-like protein 1
VSATLDQPANTAPIFMPRIPARHYQTAGVDWMLTALRDHKAVLLADDPGLGKTLQTLIAARTKRVARTLIVCPAGARRVWSGEINRWFPDWNNRVFLVEPGTKTGQVQERIARPAPLVLIIGYDDLSLNDSRLQGALCDPKTPWDLLVIDEAHYLKNPSNRTVALYGVKGEDSGIQANAAQVILLSGTPTPNHAGELWQHCRTFWPWSLLWPHGSPRAGQRMTQADFEERFTRYRDTVYGRQVSGSKNQDQLRTALATVVLRRRKDDVLPELPPLQIQDVALEAIADWERELTMSARASPLMNGRDWSSSRVTDDRLLAALRDPDPSVAALRRELGELKVPGTNAWVRERLRSVNKIVLFAWHLSVIEHLRRGLAEFDPVVITGDTTPIGRVNAVELFQCRAGVRVFIGQVKAAGTAITLTAASEVAIVEPSWVPGENVQAICRAHRLGQRDSVLASFLYLPGTLDQRIMTTFRRKASEIAELQGDQINASAG